MKYLKTILISLVVSVICIVGILAFVYYYVPLFPVNLLDENGERMLGTTIITLSGTNTMSDFPTTYNTNNSSLNAGKMEISTTTLPLITDLLGLDTIGTITIGTWNADEITVAYGGTGTTSPTLNQIMIGNGASGFKVIGFGTSGQFLTSAGDGVIPSWTTSSINEAGTYSWTGEHSWTATTTMAISTITELIASNLTTDSIIPSTATTTLTGDFNIVGNFDYSGSLYTGAKWEFISSATINSASTTVPALAKIAIVVYDLKNTDPSPDIFYRGQVILEKDNMNSVNIQITDSTRTTFGIDGGSDNSLYANFEWTGTDISINEGGQIETFAGTVYYYK